MLFNKSYNKHFKNLVECSREGAFTLTCEGKLTKHSNVMTGIMGAFQNRVESFFSAIKNNKSQIDVLTKTSHTEEKAFRLLADNSLDLIQIVNLDGLVTYASPSHESILGHKPEEYIGKLVCCQPDGSEDKKLKESFFKMLNTYEPFTCEIVRDHKHGHRVLVDLRVKPLFDENGEFKNIMIAGQEITERKRYEERLKYLSYHDTLTSLPNRRLFDDKLDQTVREAKRNQQKFAVMYMDIDKFKNINDTLGHEVGDELLKIFSKRVSNKLRENDTFARLGGDEFVIILPDVEKETDVLKVAGRILETLRKDIIIGRDILQVSSSIGIAFYPIHGTTKEQLIKNADIALYTAKEKGRNNFQTYNNIQT